MDEKNLEKARHWMTEADKARPTTGLPDTSCMAMAIWRLILHLEPAPPKEDGATQRSGHLSVATTGPALKLSGSFTVTPAVLTASQQEDLQRCLREVILAFSNSLPSTLLHMESRWINGQNLQVTCSLRIGSTANKAGLPGPAVPTEFCQCEVPRPDGDHCRTCQKVRRDAVSPSAAPTSPAGLQDSPSSASSKPRWEQRFSDLEWDQWAIDIAQKVYHENRHREAGGPATGWPSTRDEG